MSALAEEVERLARTRRAAPSPPAAPYSWAPSPPSLRRAPRPPAPRPAAPLPLPGRPLGCPAAEILRRLDEFAEAVDELRAEVRGR